MAQDGGVIVFTGIITEIGSVQSVERRGGGIRLTIHAPRSAGELHVNDSVAVSGVCQTVVSSDGATFRVEAVEETLRKTTLGELVSGSRVNLELPLRLSDRLGGHLVAGHVDSIGVVKEIEVQSSSQLVTVSYPREFLRYLIPVGSIAVDGISLTVARLEGSTFTVSVIPHTLENTTLGKVRTGTHVNLEFDLVGKYIERIVIEGKESPTKEGITPEKLARWGIGT
jgi:riboflavin synthase